MKLNMLFLTLMSFMLIQESADATAVKYTGRSQRDPFASTVVAPPAPTPKDPFADLKKETIQGYMLSADNPRVMIAGKIYRIGNLYKGAKVEKIELSGVTLSMNGKELVLPLKKGNKPNAKIIKQN